MRFVFLAATLVACWLGMQAVHEWGHVIGAQLTGAVVENVVLHPLTISRTDVADNRQPLVVVWLGPLLGVLLPLTLWGLAAAAGLKEAFLLRFFAGFCLIANGLYLGVGSIDGVGDCGDLLRHGSPIGMLWLFGVVTTPLGFALWHGQARHFGWGKAAEPLDRRIVAESVVVCTALVLFGLFLGN